MNRLFKGLLFNAFMATQVSAAPVQITAGMASLDQSSHEHILSDDVTLDDTQQHLRAASVRLKTNADNALVFAIAKGDKTQRAHLWSTEKNPTVHAYADEIEYHPNEHRVILTGHACLSQGQNSFSAPKIIYNTATQHVLSQKEGKERTTIILSESHEHFIRKKP